MSWANRGQEEHAHSSEVERAAAELGAKSGLCPRPELLQAADAGVLPSEMASEVTRHVASCGLCQSLRADLEVLDNIAIDGAVRRRIWKRVNSGIAEQLVPGGRAQGYWVMRLLQPWPVATAAALAVVMIVLGARFARERRQAPASTAQIQIPASLPESTVFRLEKAPIVIPASAAILWRGAGDHSGKDLQDALDPYGAGNYADAARRLDQLRKKYPRMAEAAFYLGVTQLFLDQDDDAVKNLKDAANLAGPPLDNEAKWYLALTLYRTGKTDLAKTLLEPLCRAGTKNSGRACAGLKELQAAR